MKTCNNCRQRENCKELCLPMSKMLKNLIKQNGLYADSVHKQKRANVNSEDIDRVLFTAGLSSIENRDVKRIVISLLPAKDTDLIKMYCEGLSQGDIAKNMNCSQAAVSKKIDSIKKKLEKSVVLVMPYVS